MMNTPSPCRSTAIHPPTSDPKHNNTQSPACSYREFLGVPYGSEELKTHIANNIREEPPPATWAETNAQIDALSPEQQALVHRYALGCLRLKLLAPRRSEQTGRNACLDSLRVSRRRDIDIARQARDKVLEALGPLRLTGLAKRLAAFKLKGVRD